MTRRSVSFLFMGDANADAETRIVNSGTNLQVDLLKVGHHGSATSSSSAFLSKAQPKTSVIEVGAGNSYGHPTSATYGRLAQVGSAIYRTDLDGEVTVTTDGTMYDVKTSQLVSGSAKTITTPQTVSSQSSAGVICDCSYNRYNCTEGVPKSQCKSVSVHRQKREVNDRSGQSVGTFFLMECISLSCIPFVDLKPGKMDRNGA